MGVRVLALRRDHRRAGKSSPKAPTVGTLQTLPPDEDSPGGGAGHHDDLARVRSDINSLEGNYRSIEHRLQSLESRYPSSPVSASTRGNHSDDYNNNNDNKFEQAIENPIREATEQWQRPRL